MNFNNKKTRRIIAIVIMVVIDVYKRQGMTIKELAETIEAHTGKKMSRQNLTQRLGRDNFQEQDMRMIAEILGCPFHLNILDDGASAERSNHIEPDRTLEVSDKADASKVVQKEEKREIPVPVSYTHLIEERPMLPPFMDGSMRRSSIKLAVHAFESKTILW